MMSAAEKEKRLRSLLKEKEKLAVAFSSGVDSTYLLKLAREELGGDILALTARSAAFPKQEWEEAEAFCREEGIRLIPLDFDILSVSASRENGKDRCYFCKKALFGAFLETAAREGIGTLAEGSNTDDEGDYRPGMRAVSELGIWSPLREARMSKAEIRERSRTLGLSTWDKPSYACLALRFAYGETVTEEKLSRVEEAEAFLRGLGLRQLRVRVHGDLARIEAEPEKIADLAKPGTAALITDKFRALGFLYVTLDLAGYESGSMNRGLN